MSSKPCVAGKSRKHEVLVRGNVHVVAEALPVQPAVPAHCLVHERGGGSVRRPGGDCRGGRPDDDGDCGDGGKGGDDDDGVDGSGEDDQPTSDGEPPPLFRARQDQTGGAGSVGG